MIRKILDYNKQMLKSNKFEARGEILKINVIVNKNFAKDISIGYPLPRKDVASLEIFKTVWIVQIGSTDISVPVAVCLTVLLPKLKSNVENYPLFKLFVAIMKKILLCLSFGLHKR